MPGEGLIQRSPQTRRAWAWPTSGGSPGAVLLGFSHLGPLRELRPLHLAIDRPWRRRSISAACSSCAGANPAATDKAILLIVERVLPEKAVPGLAADSYLIDLEMLVNAPGGRERTEAEFRAIVTAAGVSGGRFGHPSVQYNAQHSVAAKFRFPNAPVGPSETASVGCPTAAPFSD